MTYTNICTFHSTADSLFLSLTVDHRRRSFARVIDPITRTGDPTESGKHQRRKASNEHVQPTAPDRPNTNSRSVVRLRLGFNQLSNSPRVHSIRWSDPLVRCHRRRHSRRPFPCLSDLIGTHSAIFWRLIDFFSRYIWRSSNARTRQTLRILLDIIYVMLQTHRNYSHHTYIDSSYNIWICLPIRRIL